MPHLIVEYSAGVVDVVPAQRLVDAVHDAALATGVAAVDALRTRAEPRDVYAVADRHPDNQFVAITARLGPGRSDSDVERLLSALLDAVEQCLGDACRHLMLSAEVQEIDPARRINRNHLRAAVRARATDDPDGSPERRGA
ncbi:MAG: hypothetical protein AAF945_14245 [Actinomycetota bacterium]